VWHVVGVVGFRGVVEESVDHCRWQRSTSETRNWGIGRSNDRRSCGGDEGGFSCVNEGDEESEGED